jgi:hypothetical protein
LVGRRPGIALAPPLISLEYCKNYSIAGSPNGFVEVRGGKEGKCVAEGRARRGGAVVGCAIRAGFSPTYANGCAQAALFPPVSPLPPNIIRLSPSTVLVFASIVL